MTEGLKNVGPTFYRMMKAILRDQMQRNFFTDVDDIIVSSKKKETQIHDLAETVTPHVSKPHDYVNHMFMRL
jgi:hypothetical protein